MITYAFNYLRLCWGLYDMIVHVKGGDYIGDYIDKLIPQTNTVRVSGYQMLPMGIA